MILKENDICCRGCNLFNIPDLFSQLNSSGTTAEIGVSVVVELRYVIARVLGAIHKDFQPIG